MRFKQSAVAKSFETMLVAGVLATLAVSGCGSDNTDNGGGTGGAAGKRDGGIPGAGGNGDSAVLPGTGGAMGPDSAVLGPDSPAAGPEVGMPDLSPPAPDAGVDGGSTEVRSTDAASGGDAPSDQTLVTPDATPFVSEAGASEAGGTGPGCPSGKWAKKIEFQTIPGLAADTDGNLVLALNLYNGAVASDLGSGPLTSAGNSDLLVAKLNPSTGAPPGQRSSATLRIRWLRVWPSPNPEVSGSLARSRARLPRKTSS